MANEDKKDFNAMLHDNKDMPKFQIITDQKSIEKYGGSKMYFAPPIDYDKVMKKIPYGKVITVGKIREYFAELSSADFTEPITAGIFVSIVAWASYQRSEDETPYWRTLKANGELNAKYPNGIEAQKEKLEAEETIKELDINMDQPLIAEEIPYNDQPYSINIKIPPMAAIVLKVNNISDGSKECR